MHTVVLAWLLNRKKMVPLGDLPWGELLKALVTAILAGGAAFAVGRYFAVRGSLKTDLISLAVITSVWLAAIAIGLWITKSNLPGELRRKKPAAATQPEPMVDRTTGGVEP
jgi:hypothetical protein